MSLVNDDKNWRLLASVAIPENAAVIINAQGKAALADATLANGICPQPVPAGARVPVIRHGKIGGIVGQAAGAKLRPQADGTLGTAGTGPVLAIVVAEDTTVAVICSGNLDQVV